MSIVIASKGRPTCLQETLASIRRQTFQPKNIVVVVPSELDLPHGATAGGFQAIVGPLGSSAQRNAGIRIVAAEVDYIAFFDDDFELSADYLEQAVAFLEQNISVIGLSGWDLGQGLALTRDQARQMIAQHLPANIRGDTFTSRGKHFILHGCNMVIRRDVLHRELFDERLPLYSYGEDYEMTMRLLPYGQVGRYRGCFGVHLEVGAGRVREVQRGYSTIANNWYFLKKGMVHLPPPWAELRFWGICVGKNMLLTLWNLLKKNTEQDWTGRLQGQWIAVQDIFTGRSDPERVKEL